MSKFIGGVCGLVLVGLGVAGCGHQSGGDSATKATQASSASNAFQKKLQEQLLDAKPGDVIEIPAGRYDFDRGLSLTVDGVTIRGAGHDRTVLSFKHQVSGAEGLLVSASSFTLENLAIEDTRGDAIKINEGKGVTLRGVRTEWTRGPHADNGAYGIYPVQSQDVLIDGCIAIGASDAGIYVGQSRNIVVRNSRAEYNVAGIEIENSIGADVHDNLATNNTGGILVFNMPNLPQPGHSTRVFHNKVIANNHENFAKKGAAVASVPAGSGVIINSNDNVEIFANEIADNATAGVIISSYFSTGYYTTEGVQKAFDPYPEGIYIYGNTFSGGGDSPGSLDLKALKLALFGLDGRLPEVIWDGYVAKDRLVNGRLPAERAICIDNGNVGVVNADGPHKYKNPSTDTRPYRCTLPKLPAIELPSTPTAVASTAATTS
jgi:parallel beta-helix repeat protein